MNQAQKQQWRKDIQEARRNSRCWKALLQKMEKEAKTSVTLEEIQQIAQQEDEKSHKRANAPSGLEVSYRVLLRLITMGETQEISVSRVNKLADCNSAQTRRLIARLRKAGFLVAVRGGTRALYRLKKAMPLTYQQFVEFEKNANKKTT